MSVRGKSSSFVVTLRSTGGHENAPISYYVSEALTVNSLLSASDGDIIELTYGERATASFQIYATDLGRRLATRKQQIATLEQALQRLRAHPMADAPAQDVIDLRLRLIDNANVLIANEELVDLERVVLLERYLHLLEDAPELHATADRNRHPVFGIRLVSTREDEAISQAMAHSKQRIRDAVTNLGTDLSIGLTRWLIEETGTANVYLAVTGTDVAGRRVNVLERVLAGVQFYDQLLRTRYAGTSASKDAFNTRWIRDTQARQRTAGNGPPPAAAPGSLRPSTTAPGYHTVSRRVLDLSGRRGIVRQELPDTCGIGADATIHRRHQASPLPHPLDWLGSV